MWEELHNLRTGQNLTQEKLGQLVDVPGATISSWEAGGIPKWGLRLVKLCEALNVSPNALLGWETTHKSELTSGATVVEEDMKHECVLSDEDVKMIMTIIRRRTDMLRGKMQHGHIIQADVDEVNDGEYMLEALTRQLWQILDDDGLPDEEIKGIIRDSRIAK